jgi:hypothetical protein
MSQARLGAQHDGEGRCDESHRETVVDRSDPSRVRASVALTSLTVLRSANAVEASSKDDDDEAKVP